MKVMKPPRMPMGPSHTSTPIKSSTMSPLFGVTAYSGSDSNRHCSVPKTDVSYQLDYRSKWYYCTTHSVSCQATQPGSNRHQGRQGPVLPIKLCVSQSS